MNVLSLMLLSRVPGPVITAGCNGRLCYSIGREGKVRVKVEEGDECRKVPLDSAAFDAFHIILGNSLRVGITKIFKAISVLLDNFIIETILNYKHRL